MVDMFEYLVPGVPGNGLAYHHSAWHLGVAAFSSAVNALGLQLLREPWFNSRLW